LSPEMKMFGWGIVIH